MAVTAAGDATAALAQFFAALRGTTGCAFVVVGADARQREAAGTLRRHTRADVVEVSERVPLSPERVYVAPPGRRISLAADMLYPVESGEPAAGAADFFLRALADERQQFAVAVMLGEVAAEEGLRAVEEHAGLIVADREGARVHAVAPAGRLAQVVVGHLRRLGAEAAAGAKPAAARPDIEALASRVLPRDPALAAVLVDQRGEVLYVSGRTGDYLEPAPGYPNWNVCAMARAGLRDALALALPQVFRSGRKVVRRDLVVAVEERVRVVDLVVERVDEPGWEIPFAAVVFVGAAARVARRGGRRGAQGSR